MEKIERIRDDEGDVRAKYRQRCSDAGVTQRFVFSFVASLTKEINDSESFKETMNTNRSNLTFNITNN